MYEPEFDHEYPPAEWTVDGLADALLVDDASVAEQTAQALDNVVAVLAAGGATTDDVLKVTVYLADIDDFDEMNETYATYFASEPPARSAVEVANLPKGAGVEPTQKLEGARDLVPRLVPLYALEFIRGIARERDITGKNPGLREADIHAAGNEQLVSRVVARSPLYRRIGAPILIRQANSGHDILRERYGPGHAGRKIETLAEDRNAKVVEVLAQEDRGAEFVCSETATPAREICAEAGDEAARPQARKVAYRNLGVAQTLDAVEVVGSCRCRARVETRRKVAAKRHEQRNRNTCLTDHGSVGVPLVDGRCTEVYRRSRAAQVQVGGL